MEYNLDDILNEYRTEDSGAAKVTRKKKRTDGENCGPVSERERAHDAPPPANRTKAPVPAERKPSGNTGKQGNRVDVQQKAMRGKTRSGRRISRVPGWLAALITAAVLICLTGAAVKYFDFVFPNVYADGISLSWKREASAEALLEAAGWNETECAPLKLNTFCGVSEDVDTVMAGYVPDASSAAKLAGNVGREGNIFSCLIDFVCSFFRTEDVVGSFRIQNRFRGEGYINEVIASCTQRVQEAFGEEPYRIDREKSELVLIKGRGTILIDSNLLHTELVSALEKKEKELTFLPQYVEPACPDMTAVHTLVCSGPVNAAYSDDGSGEITEGKPGYEFDPVTAEKLWEDAGFSEEVRIPLTVTEPEITAEKLETLLFHDLLGAVTTKYNNSNENRSSNVRLASSKINGVILYPGQEFSFNDVVGTRTAEAGFLLAPAYAGYDDMRDEIGGGVCQVSTGLYASALFAFLEITSHTCHVYPPNYIQLGTDTTVSIPEGGGRSIDFKFRNSKSMPIKISAYCEEIADRGDGRPLKTVTVEIWGTLEEDDFMPVEFDNSYSNIYDYDRVIEPAYPDREGYKLKFTHEETEFEDDYGSGIRTLTHRKVIDKYGNVVQDRIINRTYSAGYAMDTYYYKK